MITLFIDTSAKDVSIALLKDNKIVNKIVKSIPNEHSKYAISYLEEVLKKSNVKPNEVNSIMVTNGPGSFTGIRIGLTIAKIYAYLLNIDVTLVSSLKIIALSTEGEYILSLIDVATFFTVVLTTFAAFLTVFFTEFATFLTVFATAFAALVIH